MIKMITAFTGEIDDPGVALAQIERHLAGKSLLRNSVGIIHCYEDSLESGAVRTICDALPFDVIGCTVVGAAVAGAGSPYLLTLSVLTSDDIAFAAGASEPIEESPDGPAERLF